MTLETGTRLGLYEVLSPLGAGGMGEVYKARDLNLGREVAIKVLPQELSTDSDRLRRFEQEARAASGLNHPNIVTIHEIGEHAGTPYIAMEYVDGVTLREMLGGGSLPHDKLIRYTTQMAEGLAKAHQAGIVHRDLKPENIVISEDGYVKILDFGLAKRTSESAEGSDLATMEKGTTPGTILGSVGYMSPEQARGQPADFRSDQFALGAIAYEMATGKRAFDGNTAAEMLTAILREEPSPVTLVNPKVPASVAAVIDRCLSKDPGERFDSTREIARRIHEQELVVPAQPTTRHPLAGVWAAGILAIILLMIAALFVPELRDWVSGEAETERIDSIAVLPLDNLSGDPKQEYFVDGMTEALIASLAQIEDLKVISRTSVMRFKGEGLALAEIAKQLGVEAIVEGSVLKADERVRITAQLIDTRSDEHLWAESYEGNLADVLKLQSNVSVEIAQEIRRTLAPASTSRTSAVPPAAYDAYLRGRYFFNQRELDDAIAHFQEAVRIAPDYAEAYSGLAQAYAAERQIGLARAAVEKALSLEPDLAEARVPLADILRWEWQWDDAEQQFRKAIALNPNDGFVRHAFSLFLSRLGRHDEAIVLQRQAIELDPLSPIINGELALRLYYAGRLEEALEQSERALTIDPSFGHTHAQRALVLTLMGRYEEALAATETMEQVGSFLIQPDDVRVLIFAQIGREPEAREILGEMLERRGSLAAPAVLGMLGDLDRGFVELEKMFEARHPDLNAIAHNPFYEMYRDDPRLQDLLRRMNLPE